MLGMHLHFQRFLTPKKSVRPFWVKLCVCIPLKIRQAARQSVDMRTEFTDCDNSNATIQCHPFDGFPTPLSES